MATTANEAAPKHTSIARYQVPALVAGVAGVALAAFGWVSDPAEFYRAWLAPFTFWFMIAAGALGILMLQYVTGGEWGIVIRRPLGAAARTLPLFLLLGIPLVLGLRDLYIWADPEIVAKDHLLQVKQLWLNPSGWLIRSVVYILLLSLWAWRLKMLSRNFEVTRDPQVALTRRNWSAIGLVLIVMVLTFTGVDWVMSLEPKWYSSMFGLSFTVGSGLAAFAFMTLFITLQSGSEAMRGILHQKHLRDYGNLMLAFTMLWAYMNFSQFLLIWYGNIKEETPYYLKRMHGGWGAIAIILVVFHFFLPFFMLLMRAIKDRPKTIGVVATLILLMRFVDLNWLILPALYGEHFHISWITFAAFVGIGGLWFAAFVWQIKGQTIIPVHESWVEQAIREKSMQRSAGHA